MAKEKKHSWLEKIDPIPLLLLLLGGTVVTTLDPSASIWMPGWAMIIIAIAWYASPLLKKKSLPSQTPTPIPQTLDYQQETSSMPMQPWSKAKKIALFILLLLLGYVIWPLIVGGSYPFQGGTWNPFRAIASVRSIDDALSYLAFYFLFAFFSATLLYGGVMRTSGQWPQSSGQFKPSATTAKQMIVRLLIIFFFIGIVMPLAIGLGYYYLAAHK